MIFGISYVIINVYVKQILLLLYLKMNSNKITLELL